MVAPWLPKGAGVRGRGSLGELDGLAPDNEEHGYFRTASSSAAVPREMATASEATVMRLHPPSR